MLTKAHIARFVALAGEGYAWAGVRSCSRPASDVRKALRDDLAQRQGGLCPLCGNALRNPQFNHGVSRGPKVKGFLPGNVFAGCKACNDDCMAEYGERDDNGMVIDGGVIPIERYARPDLVPMEWTAFTVLRTRR